MSANPELAAVETLLMYVLPDPMGFAERVFGQLAQRLEPDAGVTAPGEADAADGGPEVVPGQWSAAHEVLVDRNVLLSAALGACECWGEESGCPDCRGEGSVGWMPPDPELYATYVAPAASRSTYADHVPSGQVTSSRVNGFGHERSDEGEAT